MATLQEAMETGDGEPIIIVKAVSEDSDQLIKEDVSTGLVENFVLLPGIKILELRTFCNNIIIGVYRNVDDETKGGVVVFDPITTKVKQHIQTLALWCCGCDNNYLVLGGNGNGFLYIFQYLHNDYQMKNEFQLIKSTQLRGMDASVNAVAVTTSINKIVSVGWFKTAVITNLTGDIISKHHLPDYGNCIVINTECSVAFIGCCNGFIVAVDLIHSTLISTIKAHNGWNISCLVTHHDVLITGDNHNHMIKWKVNRPSFFSKLFGQSILSQMWNYEVAGRVQSLCLNVNSTKVFVVTNHYTISVIVETSQLERLYSTAECSCGVVTFGDSAEANEMSIKDLNCHMTV